MRGSSERSLMPTSWPGAANARLSWSRQRLSDTTRLGGSAVHAHVAAPCRHAATRQLIQRATRSDMTGLLVPHMRTSIGAQPRRAEGQRLLVVGVADVLDATADLQP